MITISVFDWKFVCFSINILQHRLCWRRSYVMFYYSCLVLAFILILPFRCYQVDPYGLFCQTEWLKRYRTPIAIFQQFGSVAFAPLLVLFIYLTTSGGLSILGFYTMDYKAARLVNDAILLHWHTYWMYWFAFATIPTGGLCWYISRH